MGLPACRVFVFQPTVEVSISDEACRKRDLPRKLDIIKLEYWDKGIDTTEIPYEILKEYTIQDGESTLALFLHRLLSLRVNMPQNTSFSCTMQ